jgi:ribosomal protein S6--L-glutamate ligase
LNQEHRWKAGPVMKILSYHPCIEADENRICAGRAPDESDAAAMAAATAVILNQGCYESVYRMARDNSRHVFPNYDVRFAFPGKLGQIRLFRKYGVPHPNTVLFKETAAFSRNAMAEIGFPLVFKFDWGGEGETVFLVETASVLEDILARAEAFERSGQSGFLVQEFIPHGNRTLRVVVAYRARKAYWRVGHPDGCFGASLAAGGQIDKRADPKIQSAAVQRVNALCSRTGINLAGFDLMVPEGSIEPIFLEVNYFFGRQGLGGSEAYYALLENEVRSWVADLNL